MIYILEPPSLEPYYGGMIQWNFLLLAYLVFFLLRSGTQLVLNRMNVAYLRRHGDTVPDIFRDTIDPEKLNKISAYTADSAGFGIFSVLSNQALFLVLLLSGILPWVVKILIQRGLGPVAGGLIFFAFLSVVIHIFHLPFSLYDTFRIEDRYGFNTKTFRLWITDSLKGLALSAVLGGLLLGLLLALVVHGGRTWWVWAWLGVGAVELLILWLFPVLIAPLFNKFEPIDNHELAGRIEALMARVGLRSRGVFRMDASKRSRHTNAYFTGFGKSKRIILFDTLLSSHKDEEILAILAHEIGHWKRHHVLKQLIFAEILSLVGFFVVARLLDWPVPYHTFGFPGSISYVGLFLIGALFSPVAYFGQPFQSARSRRYEREADDFSLRLMQTPEPMCTALKKLAVDNLANLNPHPLYAWFYYSHPPLFERIARLQGHSPQRSQRGA